MAKRSRKQSVVWLPTSLTDRLGAAPNPATLGTDSNIGIVLMAAIPGALGSAETTAVPVVNDIPVNPTVAGATLSDYEGSAYRLRRIVGKIFCNIEQGTTQITAATAVNFLATAGFMVKKVDDAGVPIDLNFDPCNLDNTRDPWIWRRSWTLTNLPGAIANGPGDSFLTYGRADNSVCSGTFDGPHVDAKTARIVSDEERLFLCLNMTALDGSDAQVNCRGTWITDFRVLVSMRKQSGNRRNASR